MNKKRKSNQRIFIEDEQETMKLSAEMLTMLEEVVLTCLLQENLTSACEVDITLTNDSRIREINRQFRDKDVATDVLSFPLVDMKDGVIGSTEGDYDLDEDLLMLGDIVISVEMALKQAGEYGHSIERELAFLTAHGVYHLLGYDHIDDATENRMMDKQEKVLEKLELKRK